MKLYIRSLDNGWVVKITEDTCDKSILKAEYEPHKKELFFETLAKMVVWIKKRYPDHLNIERVR